jgi:hypothetical protein
MPVSATASSTQQSRPSATLRTRRATSPSCVNLQALLSKLSLEKVSTEMSLQVLAYNMKRMINIFGAKPLMQTIAA